MPRIKLIISILFLVLLASCKNRQEVRIVPSHEWNVLLVSIDTLRADYLKLYSPSGVETPNLEQMAQEAIVFDKVISQIPYTLPSHCTMLTGLYPIGHGVKDNVHGVLSEKIETVAEIFQKQNYETAAFLGSMVLSRSTGLNKGFEYYDDLMSRADIREEDLGGIERRAEEVADSFENWFEKRGNEKHFFVFLHFYDPHAPFEPPGAFAPSVKDMKGFYKGEIRYVDFVMGKLFDFLRQKGAWDNTLVLVTSDHGEMLKEHGEIGHGFFLYQPSLKVPMILRIPGIHENKRIQDPVELVDIAPTLLSLTKNHLPNAMQGKTLLPLIEGKATMEDRYAFSESYFAAIQLGISPLRSIQNKKFKLIDAPRPELYDLKKDPTESENLASEKKAIVAELRQKLRQYQINYGNGDEKKEERIVSAEEAERFAALGYLGGNVSETSWDLQKDPKDYIDEWNVMLEATDLVQTGRYEKACPILTKILSSAKPTDPMLYLQAKCYMGLGEFKKSEAIANQIADTPQALTLLAEIYERTGRVDKTSEAFRLSLEQKFSYFTLYNYALFLKRTGRNQEALTLVKSAEESRGDVDRARPMLSEIYFILQEWNEAERLSQELMEERPWEAKWYVQLSRIYQIRGKNQEALVLLTKHYEKFSDNPEYLLRLGILCNVTGQRAREGEAFQRMIQVAPEDSRGYFYLAKTLLDSRQNLEAVIQLCTKGFQLHPAPDMQIFGHYILGNAYQVIGRTLESEQQFELAQKLETKLQMSNL